MTMQAAGTGKRARAAMLLAAVAARTAALPAASGIAEDGGNRTAGSGTRRAEAG